MAPGAWHAFSTSICISSSMSLRWADFPAPSEAFCFLFFYFESQDATWNPKGEVLTYPSSSTQPCTSMFKPPARSWKLEIPSLQEHHLWKVGGPHVCGGGRCSTAPLPSPPSSQESLGSDPQVLWAPLVFSHLLPWIHQLLARQSWANFLTFSYFRFIIYKMVIIKTHTL